MTMKRLLKTRHSAGFALGLAVLCISALSIAHGASNSIDNMPQSMPAPPKKPVVGDLLASVSNIPTPRPDLDTPSGSKMDSGMPAEERACRARLSVLGVDYEELPEIADEGECGIAHPISVTTLGAGIELTPGGVMNCATAEKAALVVRNTAAPAAISQLGSPLAGVRNASTYICRRRASGGKLSEHAKGNALDISAFILDDGREVEVVGYGSANKPEQRFMRSVRRAACGPFKTVLGPGTDPDHASHFHFDLAERRNGSNYCR